MVKYSFLSKFLHYIALNFTLIKKVAFEIDCSLSSLKNSHNDLGPHVFISGLARAGTTILLEALYSTGLFASLTYRNMPFVTAPALWNLISSKFYSTPILIDRAHSDRLKIAFDSPEAFEEIFWMTFTDMKYIKKEYLEVYYDLDDKELFFKL